MPTITVTEDLATTLQTLQRGGVILKYKAGRWYDAFYLVSPVPNGYDRNNNPRISEDLLKELLKAHLIEEREHTRLSRVIKKAWKISFTGQSFVLPPRQFWVSNEPTS
jgi:hypothetical protein